METTGFIIKNKPIPKNAENIIKSLNENGEAVQFVIVGDLSLDGKYAETSLILTDCAAVYCNGSHGEEKRYE
jgi:hypothetical protein